MTWLEVEEHRVMFPYQRVVSDGGAVFRSKIVPSKVYHGKQLDQLTNGLEAMRQVANQELDSEAIQTSVHI